MLSLTVKCEVKIKSFFRQAKTQKVYLPSNPSREVTWDVLQQNEGDKKKEQDVQ